MGKYHIVHEYTAVAGAHKGGRFIMNRSSKEAFDPQRFNYGRDKTSMVIAEGISLSEAQVLCALESPESSFRVAMKELEVEVSPGTRERILEQAWFKIGSNARVIRATDPETIFRLLKLTAETAN